MPPSDPTMTIITDKAEMRAWSRAHRAAGRSVGFVPTMVREGGKERTRLTPGLVFGLLILTSPLSLPDQGCLHAGHLSLVDIAK